LSLLLALVCQAELCDKGQPKKKKGLIET
jgi:hypothetical protein